MGLFVSRFRCLVVATLMMYLTAGVSICGATYPQREMRAAWVTTAWGLDWPERQGTSVSTGDAQRRQLCNMLDRLKESGLNAVFFQVRSMSDAMYKSSYEPWSRFLTGERGLPPSDSAWDPLAYCVEQCHLRGLECHAWVNPLRFSTGRILPSTKHDREIKSKGWLLTYSRKNKGKTVSTTTILNPGYVAVRDYVVDVCRDIVSRYDVDGLVFDDYFYPEGMDLGCGYDFDLWKKSGTSLSQADWRRDNIARLIAGVYEMLQSTKPYVRFGVSPAGVAGADGEVASQYGLPPCYAGHDWMYDGISCDPLRWLADGTVDYVSPQIYWRTDNSVNPYLPISKWWSEVAARFGRHFFASHTLEGPANESVTDKGHERGLQIEGNREYAADGISGSALYSLKHLVGESGSHLRDYLADNHFRYKALPPPMTWKSVASVRSVSGLRLDGTCLRWDADGDMRYVVYAVSMPGEDSIDCSRALIGHPSAIVDMTYFPYYNLTDSQYDGQIYAVSSLDRYGNESEPVWLTPPGVATPRQAEIADDNDYAVEYGVIDAFIAEAPPAENIPVYVPDNESVSMSDTEYASVDAEPDESVVPESHDGIRVDLGCVAQSARLFNSHGNMVSSGRGVDALYVRLPGVYVLRMVDDAGNPVTRKIHLD